jgi:flagellar basal-body rod modification protein FlgD
MSSTNPIGSSSNTSNTSNTSNDVSNASAALDITPADFLQLITAQMKAQNPLQPSDPTQFLTQLEQMSQVSSMQNMEGSLTSLQTSLQSSQMANGASLIGQTVLTPVTSATLDTKGGSVKGALIVPSDAKTVTVTIRSQSGALINSFQVAPSTSGLTNFTWNGMDTNGTAMDAGNYSISATSSDGTKSTALTPLIAGKVSSVVVDPSNSQLDVTTENGTVPLSSVVSLQ